MNIQANNKNIPLIIKPEVQPNSASPSPSPSARSSKLSKNPPKNCNISSQSSLPGLQPENPDDILNKDPRDVDPKKLIEYGEMCYKGFIPDHTVNFAKAVEFFKYAADVKKDPQAMIKYGNMLRFGFGCEIDKDKAQKYYQDAANFEIGDDCADKASIQELKKQAKKLFDSLEHRKQNLATLENHPNGEPLGIPNFNQNNADKQINKPTPPQLNKTPNPSPRNFPSNNDK